MLKCQKLQIYFQNITCLFHKNINRYIQLGYNDLDFCQQYVQVRVITVLS